MWSGWAHCLLWSLPHAIQIHIHHIISSRSNHFAPGGSLQGDGSWDKLQAPPRKKLLLKPCLIFIIPPLPHSQSSFPSLLADTSVSLKGLLVKGPRPSFLRGYHVLLKLWPLNLFIYYQNWTKEDQEVPKWITWVPTVLFTVHVREALPPLNNQNPLPGWWLPSLHVLLIVQEA